MLWRIIPFVAAVVSLPAAILPESFGPFQRTETSAVTPEDPQVWTEYGLQAAESAGYSGGSGPLQVVAYRLADPTGALAAFHWQKPADSRSDRTSARTPNGSLMVHKNYLIRVDGERPQPADLQALFAQLPDAVSTSLPPLYDYLPEKGRVANSERYLLGNASLARFEPQISPALAAFDRGAEAALARYRLGGQNLQLTLFSYPTPQMAIERARQFEALPGAAVKRVGPLLAVVPGADGIPAAQGLLAAVSYQPQLTWSEEVPKNTPQDAAKMVLAILALAGILIAAALGFGLLFGGSRVLAKKFGLSGAQEEFTSLHLDSK